MIAVISLILLSSMALIQFENVTELAYDLNVYVEYVNDTPYFYIESPKNYIYKPVTVCAEVYDNFVRDLGFRVNCSNFDVLISERDEKSAIVFVKCSNSTVKELIWLKNPLKLPPIEVEGCNISERGEVLAVYSDGGKAVVRVGDKIYVGFKPNKAVIANLLAFYSIKEVKRDYTPYLIGVPIVIFVPLIIYLASNWERFLHKVAGILSVLVLVLGYFKFDEEFILLNDTRRTIYEYILDNPGVHLRQILRDLKLSVSTATWHLRVLERAGLINKKKVGNRIIYYPSGMDKRDVLVVAVMNDRKVVDILNYLAKVGKAHLRKIARDLNMNIETVRQKLMRLESMGLILSEEEGNRIVYSLNPDFIPLLSNPP